MIGASVTGGNAAHVMMPNAAALRARGALARPLKSQRVLADRHKASPDLARTTMDFTSVKNIHERAVWTAIAAAASRYPALHDDPDLLADVACVALNRVPPRYIRHEVDLAFFLTERERDDNERLIADAVEFAFGFVQARHLMAARR